MKHKVKRGKMVNGFDPSQADKLDDATRAVVQRRAQLLGPAYRLFYQNPVKFVRGRGVHLYDDRGNEYLDAYNNVVSIGHANARVNQAISNQLEALCTHTRYLQDGILDFAEQLLATFEDPISHAMFTCTGSEANDLAMRIAMFRTGKRGIIVTSEAYHGNSHLTASFSPSMGENSPLGGSVRRVPAPDSYRRDIASLGQAMAAQVQEQIDDLHRSGEGLAAFVCDSLFSSDGLFCEPSDLLRPVAAVVRKAGGLFVADEVQCGFGRSGTHMWGYQRHGIIPDIVTMGKPMGNGYPVAGIAVRPDVVEEFGHAMRYFNTFGGNTVAMAAAKATLDVIQDEGLIENANMVGSYILGRLKDIQTRHEIIGDVRGVGLYFGVEIVADRATRTADSDRTRAIVNAMRERRVLISATGSNANNLKIRPPLIFTLADADRLIQELEAVVELV